MFLPERTPAPKHLWLAVAISVWAAWFLFLFDAALSARVPKEKVRLWVVVLLLGHMFAMPVYWYRYVLRRPEDREAARGGSALPL